MKRMNYSEPEPAIIRFLLVNVVFYVVLSVACAIWMRDRDGWKAFLLVAAQWGVVLALIWRAHLRARADVL